MTRQLSGPTSVAGPGSNVGTVTHYELAGLGRETRMQEGCKLFGWAEEPTQVKEGEVVVRETTTVTTAAVETTTTTKHQW